MFLRQPVHMVMRFCVYEYYPCVCCVVARMPLRDRNAVSALSVCILFAYCISRQCEILINLFLVFAIMKNIFPRATLGFYLVQGCEDRAFDLLERLIFFHAKYLLLKQYAVL